MLFVFYEELPRPVNQSLSEYPLPFVTEPVKFALSHSHTKQWSQISRDERAEIASERIKSNIFAPLVCLELMAPGRQLQGLLGSGSDLLAFNSDTHKGAPRLPSV